MHRSNAISIQNTVLYLRQPGNWGDIAFAAISGYAVALAAWEITHAAALAAFVLQNDLTLDARRGLALWLAGGAVVGVIAWLGVSLLLARRLPMEIALSRSARGLLLATLLPFLPVLAIPNIEDTAPFFSLACVGVMVVLAAVIVAGLARPLPAQPAGAASADSPSPALTGVQPVKGSSSCARSGLVVTLGLALAYALFMSLLTVARHDSFLTNAFDLGIHDQSIYNILHSGYMRTTLYGPYAIDYIGDHFSPILFLLAPIYALRQDARTLLVLQSLFLAAGAVPLYFLARLKTRSVLLALALVVAYLLHPALHGVNLADFHQIALVVPFLLAALYFLEADRVVPFLIALTLALFVKEEVALTVAAIGAYAFLGKGRYRLGAAVTLVALLYFAVVVGWIMPRLGGVPQIDTRFGGYIAPGAGGISGVAWTLWTNPWFTAIHIFGNQGKLLFLLQVFLPVLFLPVLAPIVAWLVALPSLAVLMLTTAHTQYDITYHYSAHLLPSVFFLAVLGLAGRPARRVPTRVIAAALLVSALGMSYLYGQILPKGRLELPQPDAHDRVVTSFFADVPAGASISTMGAIAPHLTARETIYLFPDVADAEYLLLDTDVDANYWPHEGLKARDRAVLDMLPHLRNAEFGVLREQDGVILLKRGHHTAGNDNALKVMFSPSYEAEELRSDFGDSVVPDADASAGQARAVTPAQRPADGKNTIVYGPYLDLQAGVYRATFIMKASSPPAGRVATIDVFTHKDGYPRAVREVQGADFTAPGYQGFTLEFDTGGQVLEDVEFRAFYDFSADLWLDRIDVEYVRP